MDITQWLGILKDENTYCSQEDWETMVMLLDDNEQLLIEQNKITRFTVVINTKFLAGSFLLSSYLRGVYDPYTVSYLASLHNKFGIHSFIYLENDDEIFVNGLTYDFSHIYGELAGILGW